MTKRTNPPVKDPTDEKGNPIVSNVLYETRCEWCDVAVPVRGAGRRPRFCGPAHRLAMHRAVESYRRAVEDAQRAQAEADAKVEQARRAIARGAGDWPTGLDTDNAQRRLRSIRFVPARNETHPNDCPKCGENAYHGVITEPGEAERWACDNCGYVAMLSADEAMTEPAWTYVKGSGWVDPATIEA